VANVVHAGFVRLPENTIFGTSSNSLF